METLQNKEIIYNIIDVEVVGGSLTALNELIKKHNDYRSRVNTLTVDKAMYMTKYVMNSPYINDTGLFEGYAFCRLAVLPEITKEQIQSAIDNGSDTLRGFIQVLNLKK